jgi:uncharacterized membrane-anchored protein
MRNRTALLAVVACALGSTAYAQKPALDIKWQEGPSVGILGSQAEIRVPTGFVFAGASDTRKIMEAMQNPTSGTELGYLSPAENDWFVVFEFDDVGYIRDDEKGSLDADAMLASIKKGTEAGNALRKKRGWSTMTILGWEQTPRYNETTHNLEWGIRGQSSEGPVINYNTRLLGRGGVMRVTLVTDPDKLAPTLPKFKEVLTGFDFKQGKKYAEYREGDKLAEYGLAALVVGGASAVALKAGVFKWLWKLLVVGGAAIAVAAKKIFSRNKPPAGGA